MIVFGAWLALVLGLVVLSHHWDDVPHSFGQWRRRRVYRARLARAEASFARPPRRPAADSWKIH